MSREQREHIRSIMPAVVKVTHSSVGEITLKARDLSDGGVYVYCDSSGFIPVGSEAKMQAVNDEIEMPVINVKIVRHDSEGMGMAFID